MAQENRLKVLFKHKKHGIVSIYCTAGFPRMGELGQLLRSIQDAGADLIEIGMPFSDPVADGPTIQAANEKALANGMTLKALFAELDSFRARITVPVLLMGYVNPVMQFGFARFCSECARVGIDGVILPDLPPEQFIKNHKADFDKFGLSNIFLITPFTSEERIRWIDSQSSSFIYAVSAAAVTGGQLSMDGGRRSYLQHLAELKLNHPVLVGFGISNREDCRAVSQYVAGAIIGSSFIRAISDSKDVVGDAYKFVKGVVS